MFPFQNVLVIALIVIALSGLRVAQEYERGVIFRLGRDPAGAKQNQHIAGRQYFRVNHGVGFEVGAENNSTTVLMIPSDFVSLAHSLNDYLQRQASSRSSTENKS